MSLSRRDFLAATAVSVGGLALAESSSALAQDSADLRVAVIGLNGQGNGHIRTWLKGTLRDSDEFFELSDEAVIVLSETDTIGARTAIRRYKEANGHNGNHDVRFAVASFPTDSRDLLLTALGRLTKAKQGMSGEVVYAG